MLNAVVYIHRSGSTTAAKSIAQQHNLEFLGEVMHKYRLSPISEFINQVNEILKYSKTNNIMVKFHILDLIRVKEYSNDLFEIVLRTSDKLYYPLRLDYKSQIISQMIAGKTNEWSKNRNTSKVIILNESDIPRYTKELVKLLEIQGSWFKKFTGELIILEHQSYNSYPKYNYKIIGIKSFLKKTHNSYLDFFDDLDVLSIFNNSPG